MDTKTEMRNLCHNIYQLRKTNDLTQKEMAKILKIGVGSLRKLEKGIIPPKMKVDVLFQVHFAFGVSLRKLVDECLPICSE